MRAETRRKTNTNRPVIIFIAAVYICPTFKKDGSDCERGELADRIAANTSRIAVNCQVKWTVAVLSTWLELQESVKT